MRSYSFVGSLGKRIVMMITNGTITVIIIISMKGTRHFAMGTNKDIYWSPFPRGWHWCRNQYHSEASEVRWGITLGTVCPSIMYLTYVGVIKWHAIVIPGVCYLHITAFTYS